MSLQKANGIVLETREIAEADSLIVVFLENGLKESFLIKGIRKSKRRELVSREIGTLVSLIYYEKQNKEIFSIREISVLERFEKLKASYSGFLAISLMVELVNKFIPRNLEQKKIFDLLSKALFTLNELGISEISLPFFKIRLLQILGYAPKDFHCLHCSCDIFQKSSAFIHPTTLEINCIDCGLVPENHLDVLRIMKKFTHSNYRNVVYEVIPLDHLNQFDSILNQFIHFQLGFELKSQSLLSNNLDFQKIQTSNKKVF